MTSEQITMLTQMITQNRPNTNMSNTQKEDSSFKDMLDDKKQISNTKEQNSVPAKNESENPQIKDDEGNIAAKQALLANLLFAQSITPVANQMSQQEPQSPTETVIDQVAQSVIQPMVQGELSSNVQTAMQNVQTNEQTVAPQVQAETSTVELDQQVIEPEQQNKTNVNTESGQFVQNIEKQTETVQTANAEQNGENAQDMMQGKTSQASEKPEAEQTNTEVEVQTPLFKNIESTPVKVGENTPVLDTKSPNMEQELKDIVTYNLKQSGDKVEIQLNPGNLGKITIELVQKDGSMSVVMTAENSKTLSLLAQHAGGLETIMQERLAQPVQVYVDQQQPQQQFDDSQRQNQQQQQQQNKQPGKDEQQNFIDQLRLGLYQMS